MTAKIIAFTPGTGGNFLSRVCEQSHELERIRLAQYPPSMHSGSRDPGSLNWIEYERAWTHRAGTHNYRQGHHMEHDRGHPVWLRITVADLAEWRWAVANALWKNSWPLGPIWARCSDPGLPAQHRLRLRDLWQWQSLSSGLAAMGLAINEHMHDLWQQWRCTWCPRAQSVEWQRECERLWDGLSPAHVQRTAAQDPLLGTSHTH